MKTCLCVWSVVALSFVSACTKSSPSRPTVTSAEENSASVTDAKTGVTLTTPAPVSPAANAQIAFAQQPITLTVRNAATTGSTALTYTFQVASDAGFGTIVASKDSAAGAGQTSVALDKLAGAKTYFWRARANSGAVGGLFSTPRAMVIGPEIVIQAPGIVAPANGGSLSGQGLLIAANAARTGPAGTLTYRFEVSDSSSFANLVFVAPSVNEQSGQTSARMDANLTANATYYWRVRASDPANNVIGPYSAVVSFKFVPFDMRQATIHSSPSDLGSWPETAKITSVALNPDGMEVDFDRRDGPNRWPDEPFGSGSIEYTLGMCLNINNHWECSAVVQFWYGRELSAGGRPDEIGLNWFYDVGRWGIMTGYQPSRGEIIGLFVGAGNLRGRNDPGYVTCPRVCERSNVVLVPFADDGSANFTFSAKPKVLSVKR